MSVSVMICVCVRLEGRGCVVCINEMIGIKVHGGEREKKFYKNTRYYSVG